MGRLELPATIIPADARHIGLVYDSWVGGVEAETPQSVDRNWLRRAQRALIDQLVAAPTTRVLVAADPEDPDQVYGWAAGEPHLLHWVWVKPDFRRMRVMSRLVRALCGPEPGPLEVTAWTRDARDLHRWNPRVNTYRLCEVLR